MKHRHIEPEILDSLPPDHPAVLENRRDLLRLNRLMGNFSWMRNQLQQLAVRTDRIIEVGAGDGALALDVAHHMPRLELDWVAIDRAVEPAAWPKAWSWICADLQAAHHYQEMDGVVGNLILHQFGEAELQQLGAVWNKQARYLLFCEPLRSRWALGLLCAGQLIGLGPIARYDGAVSIRAGFRGEELPNLLQLDPTIWEWRISTTFLGAYRMAARRRDNA